MQTLIIIFIVLIPVAAFSYAMYQKHAGLKLCDRNKHYPTPEKDSYFLHFEDDETC
jgi:hypothetical protein